jgi:hypothetical protein
VFDNVLKPETLIIETKRDKEKEKEKYHHI